MGGKRKASKPLTSRFAGGAGCGCREHSAYPLLREFTQGGRCMIERTSCWAASRSGPHRPGAGMGGDCVISPGYSHSLPFRGSHGEQQLTALTAPGRCGPLRVGPFRLWGNSMGGAITSVGPDFKGPCATCGDAQSHGSSSETFLRGWVIHRLRGNLCAPMKPGRAPDGVVRTVPVRGVGEN